MKHCKTTKRSLLIGTAIVLLLAAACIFYINDYYPADMEAIEAFVSGSDITRQVLQDNALVYIPENPTAGFLFYPGGKVEFTAYEPLMLALAERNILCVLMKMPGNLAVLDINAADGIPEQFPEITTWYIGGHSLGGSMAATHVAENTDLYQGLVLLASYSTADLSNTEFDILSVYGREDGVLNAEKYNENKVNLPEDFTEIVIDGGCHAYFGMYGSQAGDGTPTITNEEQIVQTADYMADFLLPAR